MISHANPEDDDLAIWLATQLASEGYKVWCDKVQFLAGEHFWADIDHVIRTRSCKVIYILSRTSNELGLRGFTKELNLALTVQRGLVKEHGGHSPFCRFLLPVAKDDLPTSDYNVHFVGGTNVLPFQSWARGFYALRTLLQEDGVPTFQANKPSSVKNWWNTYRNVSEGRRLVKHKIASNFFPIKVRPEFLYLHYLTADDTIDLASAYPVYHQEGRACSFAAAHELRPVDYESAILKKDAIPIRTLLSRNCPLKLRKHRADLAALMRCCWEWKLEDRPDTRNYEMSNGKTAAYFTKPSDSDTLTVSFNLGAGFSGRRKIVGSFGGGKRKDGTVKPKHFYHFAIDAHPIIAPFGFQLSSHVAFTDDGEKPWASKLRTHAARRSFCSQWYNDRWRDCLFAWIFTLSDGMAEVRIPVSTECELGISCLPRLHSSHVFFEKVLQTYDSDESFDLAEEIETASDLVDTDIQQDDVDELGEES